MLSFFTRAGEGQKDELDKLIDLRKRAVLPFFTKAVGAQNDT